jgi:hypothetical protein
VKRGLMQGKELGTPEPIARATPRHGTLDFLVFQSFKPGTLATLEPCRHNSAQCSLVASPRRQTSAPSPIAAVWRAPESASAKQLTEALRRG